MLCLYLETLIVGHTFCSMLGILNRLTLEKELHNFMTNYNGFWTKMYTHKPNIIKNKNNP